MTTTTIARAPATIRLTPTSTADTETISTGSSTTTPIDAAAALAVRRAGWRVLRDLHTASDALNAAIVAASRASGAPVRIVGLPEQGQDKTDKTWAQRQAQALDALPACWATYRDITEHLVRPDCFADLARGEIVLRAEALGAADVALDDALTLAALARPSTSAEAASEYALVVAQVGEAQTQALDAITRAEALGRDLAPLPNLLGALRVTPAWTAEPSPARRAV